ncbi:hypothetical protein DTO271D3_600 [Paecilomyces variotii]|nr:hypothetical protein DTO271D3_600 [Paecilomyces variotii]
MSASSLSSFFAFGSGSGNTSDSDDDDGVSLSNTSTASADLEHHPIPDQAHDAESAIKAVTPSKLKENERPVAEEQPPGHIAAADTKKRLQLLDLPVDILKEIVKEVTHTNDLTSLCLTCSALHSLAIPHMYSRFDIVWPDTLSAAEHPAGVDALSYGLATLVMGEDVFTEIPRKYAQPSRRSPCPHCGCNSCHPTSPTIIDPIQTQTRKSRRGNYFAQYTRKFSVGNGPLTWVQEYSITKETGKMLGTLVALAVARMVNLESFVWDMPTGVLRDVWMALSSLADRPGHECRLERVWVRWHDNSENPASVMAPNASGYQTSLQRYSHVEYPTLSILPALKSLSVLDIDEPSYLEEMAVLIERSREKLRELRIGISMKAHLSPWLRPLDERESEEDAVASDVPNWPRIGGVLDILLGTHDEEDHNRTIGVKSTEQAISEKSVATNSENIENHEPDEGNAPGQLDNTHSTAGQVVVPITEPPEGANSDRSTSSGGDPSEEVAAISATSQEMPSSDDTTKTQVVVSKHPMRIQHEETNSHTVSKPSKLKLGLLELERIILSIPTIMNALDWRQLTSLTILRCEGHEKLWRALRRQYTPSSPTSERSGIRGKLHERKDSRSSPEYPLRIKSIHTDAVSPYLILFLKETIAPNSLESIFLQEGPMQRASLKRILVDSTERTPAGIEVSNGNWRKWVFDREMLSFITSGQMPHLHELGMAINHRDWHFFLQRLPYVFQLRSLYLPNIDPVDRRLHVEPKELALQILDIVTLRPEIQLCYLGIRKKCYEIIERTSKQDAFDDVEISQDDLSPDSGGPEDEDEINNDDEDADSDDFSDGNNDYDSDIFDSASASESDDNFHASRSRVSFRLREILFYDDKVSIFRARHGEL